jgi:hypothetical protein
VVPGTSLAITTNGQNEQQHMIHSNALNRARRHLTVPAGQLSQWRGPCALAPEPPQRTVSTATPGTWGIVSKHEKFT